MLCPPPLKPGDRIRVIAPSSPFDRTLVLRGLAWLGTRYCVEHDPGMFTRSGFLAGSDARRLAELNAALRAPGVRAIVAARGGYGLTRIAHAADMRALRDDPRWLVGFSDVTALHLEASRARVATLHGHNVAGLGRGDAAARLRWIEALEAPETPRRLDGLETWHGGEGRGPLFGGNLTVLATCAAAGRLRLPDGAVLLLEDVTETAYRIDRMLSALLVSGVLDRTAAVVVGEMVDCTPGRHGVPVEAVLRERLAQLSVPVVAGLPVGHGRRNDPVPLGLRAEVDGTRGQVVLCPG